MNKSYIRKVQLTMLRNNIDPRTQRTFNGQPVNEPEKFNNVERFDGPEYDLLPGVYYFSFCSDRDAEARRVRRKGVYTTRKRSINPSSPLHELCIIPKDR